MQKSFFEENGGTYTLVGDILFPNLELSDDALPSIGKYGRMRERYLREQHPISYTAMMLSGTLDQHLAEIDQTCEERMALMIRQMKVQEGVTEALKAADQMEWVRRMNSIHNLAEEIVLQELVYC